MVAGESMALSIATFNLDNLQLPGVSTYPNSTASPTRPGSAHLRAANRSRLCGLTAVGYSLRWHTASTLLPSGSRTKPP
mgnify:CR=1 FL=1